MRAAQAALVEGPVRVVKIFRNEAARGRARPGPFGSGTTTKQRNGLVAASLRGLVGRTLSLLLACPSPKLRVELPESMAAEEGVLSLLEESVAAATAARRELAVVLREGVQVPLKDSLVSRWEDLGARVLLTLSQGDSRGLPAVRRRLAELTAAGAVAVVECELFARGLSEWLEELETLAPARLRFRLGTGASWGPEMGRLESLLTEWLKRAGRRAGDRPSGLDLWNLYEEEEPNLLSSALAVDHERRVLWASGLVNSGIWPELAAPAGSLRAPRSLESLFFPPSRRHRWARERLSGKALSLWLDNVSADLRFHAFMRSLGSDFRDRSEGVAIRRGVLDARLPDQDRFLRLHLPELKSAYYQLRSACLYDCVFCRHKGPEPGQSLAEVRAFVAANARVGRRSIALVGNEPLLHPQLEQIVGLCREHGFEEVEVSTSGAPLADPARAARLKAAGVTAVSMPLHSADESEHDAITRSAGSFRDAVRAIENLLRLGGLRVYLHANALRQNLHSLPALARLASSWGVPLAVLALRPKEPENMRENFGAIEPSYAELSVPREARLIGFPICVTGGVAGAGVSETMKLYSINRNPFKVAACASCPESPRCPGTSREHLVLHPRDRDLLRAPAPAAAGAP